MNETAGYSHWHIPQSHFFEEWSDLRTLDGTVNQGALCELTWDEIYEVGEKFGLPVAPPEEEAAEAAAPAEAAAGDAPPA